MNKKIITIALALTLPLTVLAFPGGEGGGFEGKKGNRVERLARKLDLSTEQKTKMEAIFKQQREKLDAIKEETRARMQDVLSADQMKKLDAIKARRKEKRQERQAERKNKKQNRMQGKTEL